MKTPRYILSTTFLLISFFALLTYASCKGKCKDIQCKNGGDCEKGICDCPLGYKGDLCETPDPCSLGCLNGGECKDGACICDPGFEGPTCEVFTRVKFVRYWRSGFSYYTFITSTSNSAIQVKITNMANAFFIGEVNAYVEGNTITILGQTPDNNNRTIQGTGTYDINTNKLTWHYTLYAAPDTTYERTEVWSPAT